MQKIVPHVWFDKEAVEATEFYTGVFDDSEVIFTTRLHETPSGDVDIVGFKIMGFEFLAISAGPLFKPNPFISFTVVCKTVEEVDELWKKLSQDGTIRMELGEYPFSPRYGWIQDKYGISWQIIFFSERPPKPSILPHLTFTNAVCGKAEEAIRFYASIFPDATIEEIHRYQNQAPDNDGTVAHAFFEIAGQSFGAMDSAKLHDFTFNEGISFVINCKNQKEIDYFWEKLSAVPESEQCGWVKDKYGISWQILPDNMNALMSKNLEKTTPAMLKMKKINIESLRKAGE